MRRRTTMTAVMRTARREGPVMRPPPRPNPERSMLDQSMFPNSRPPSPPRPLSRMRPQRIARAAARSLDRWLPPVSSVFGTRSSLGEHRELLIGSGEDALQRAVTRILQAAFDQGDHRLRDARSFSELALRQGASQPGGADERRRLHIWKSISAAFTLCADHPYGGGPNFLRALLAACLSVSPHKRLCSEILFPLV